MSTPSSERTGQRASENGTGTPGRTGRPGQTAPAKDKGKILGIPREYAIWGGLAVAGGIAFILWRRHKAGGTATAGTATSSATQGTACTDQYGNPGTMDSNGICESLDESGSLAALQTELQGLEGSGGGGGTVGVTGTTTSGTTTGTTTAKTTTATTTTGTGGTTTAGTTTAATTTPAPATKPTFKIPAGLSQTPYATFVDLGWTAVPGATSGYHYQVLLAAGTVSVHDASTNATSVRVSGLKPKTQYEWRMAVHATAAENSSPWSPTRHFFTT